jgi:hypothetical protein
MKAVAAIVVLRELCDAGLALMDRSSEKGASAYKPRLLL